MNTLLQMSLEAGVTLRIAELIRAPADERQAELERNRERWVELVASKSDLLMYGGGRPGEVAEVHTALVNALAHMAFVPGGVHAFDLHFQVVLDPPSAPSTKMPPMQEQS